MKRAALFDLDRTLVRVNTATLFTRWRLREGEVSRIEAARVAWWALRYSLGAIDAEAVARKVVRPMRGREEAPFARRVERWALDEVLPHVSPLAVRELRRRQEAGDLCAILTGSTAYSAEPVARALGIEHVMSTRLEVRDGRFTGEIAEPFCYGAGKVVAAERWAAIHGVDLDLCVFYTDSISDLPMMMRVGRPIAVNPDPRLRFTARRRGWEVLRW